MDGFRNRWALVALFCITFTLQHAFSQTSPGLVGVVSQKFIDYGMNLGVNDVEKLLSNRKVDDISGEANTPVGKVEYWVTNAVIQKVSIPSYALKITASGLEFNVDGAVVSLSADWKYKKKHFIKVSDHVCGLDIVVYNFSGTADIGASDATLGMAVSIGAVNERLAVSSNYTSCDVGDLSIKLHGGESWLYDLFIKAVKGSLQKNLNKALQNALTEGVDKDAEAALAKLPLLLAISPKGIDVDVAILEQPVFGENFFAFGISGAVVNGTSSQPLPFAPSPLPAPSAPQDAMVGLYVTDFVPRSALYLADEDNMLSYTASKSTLPESIASKLPLKTSAWEWRLLAPRLEKDFPHEDLAFEIVTKNAPSITFGVDSTAVEVDILLAVVASPGTQNEKTAFELDIKASFAGTPTLNNGTLSVSLSTAHFDTSVATSNVGDVHFKLLTDAINFVMKRFADQKLSQYLHFDLPSVEGLSLVNPSLQTGKGYVYIQTDVAYTPPKNF